jgi:hypothetical protein
MTAPSSFLMANPSHKLFGFVNITQLTTRTRRVLRVVFSVHKSANESPTRLPGDSVTNS